jgi:hypothetical protein
MKMGCFYTGFDYKNRVNGYFKIGETGDKTPARRLASIRSTDSFECLGYLLLDNDSKAERWLVESYVRMKLARECAELTHIQNDHFTYKIASKAEKYSQAQMFADMALNYAKEICDREGISYKVGTKKYKRS